MLAILFGVICAGVGVYFWWNSQPFDGQTVSGKRVLVTGCATGLGKATAYAYAKHGARLIITDICGEPLVEVGRRCESHGAKQVVTVAADLTLAADRERLFAAVQQHFDGGLDQLILVHVSVTRFARWAGGSVDEDLAHFRSALQINFVSYVELATLAYGLLEKTGGCIGVVSSVAGKVPTAYLTSYSATKHAVQGFFSTWRAELETSKSKVSITICNLGTISTESLLNYVKSGHVRVDAKSAVTPAQAAQRILRGVTQKEREFCYPFTARLIIEIHKIFPKLIETLVERRISE